MDINNNALSWCRLDIYGSGWGLMSDSCERGVEYLASIEGGEFVDQRMGLLASQK
jgi:hypothetical protein